MIDPGSYLVIALAFLAAGFVKGVIGLGLPTVSMGLLALVLPPAQAAALLIVPSLVTNVWQMAAGPAFASVLKRLWPMMAAVAAGTWATAGLLASGAGGLVSVWLGLALVVYAAVGLAGKFRPVPPRAEPWASPLAGGVTGLISGLTGTFVIPAVPYLQALGMCKEELIQALGLSFTVSTLALGAALWRFGAFDVQVGALSLLAVLPAVLGMLLGQGLRHRFSAETFRRWFLAGMLLVGCHLALKAVW